MTKIFISYSRSVKQEVGKVVDLLRAAGHEVWWDGDIPIIADWWATILDNIEWCEVFVFVVSEKSVQSAYCLAELKYGTDRNRPILPFVIDDHSAYTIPPQVTPMRNQWFEYDGDPARMLRQIISASGKIQWSHHPDMPAPRPPEPNTGSGSLIKQFQQAVSLAEDGHFDEAIKRFRSVASLDFKEWGKECQAWIVRLQLYALIAELADHKSTLIRAFKKWDEYLETYDAIFDPLNVRVKLRPASVFPPAPPLILPPLQQGEKTLLRVEDILPPPFEWCEIPGGTVVVVEGGYLRSDTAFEIPSFSISKYPVTNAQYAKFIEAGGYQEKRWWTESGWQARELEWNEKTRSWQSSEASWAEPRYWNNQRWNDAEAPVVGISWYEALAFCHWLTETSDAALRLSCEIALPTEQQWQRAAQGDDMRMFPWGNEFDQNKCNTSESQINHTTPVTQYSLGASPYGVLDMSGNVWEWCLNNYAKGDTKVEGTDFRTVRGGSWYKPKYAAEAVHRVGRAPYFRYYFVGFRMALVPVS